MVIRILALLTIGMLASSIAQTNNVIGDNVPKITYIGEYEPNPKKDLELIDTIYKEYQKMKSSQKSRLEPYRHRVFPGQGQWEKMTDGSQPSIKAEYPEGVNIITREVGNIIIWEKNPYEAKAFGLSKE
jgi:hypothetical protein